MITYSIINKSELEGALRLDAEYYQPEYLAVSKKLKLIPHETLDNISENLASFGAYELTNYIVWQDTGVPFLEAENIKEGFIDYESVHHISEKVDEILKKSRVTEGEVLLSMSGSVGNAAVADRIPPKLNSNQDIVKIKLKDNYSPYFLATFLNSKYGKMQVLRLPVGSVQQHIFLWQTKTLLIPSFPRNFIIEIEKIYKQSLSELENSKLFYSQAEDLLLEELGLIDYKVEDDLSFVVNLSDVKSSRRTDPDYFQPKYERLISKLKDQESKLLPEVIDNIGAKFNPQSEPDKIFRYVELANINSSIGIIDGFSEVSGKEAPSRAKRLLKQGDVVVSSIGGSLDKVAIVDKESERSLASTGFFQFRSKKILPEVLLVIAKSIVLQSQLEKQVAGTILAAVPNETLKNIIIPVLPAETQQKIADSVRKSHEARKKSKELLDEAKRKVEEMIEKGGEKP